MVKTAGTPVTHADGTVTNTWTVTATNTGNEPLANLDITDDLTAAGVPTGYTITNHTATPPFTPNPTFDGDTDTHLITPAPLPIDATITITFEVTFTPTLGATISNLAEANTTGGLTDTPVSTQSAPPGTPYEPGDPTTVGPITATHGPAFSVKKQTCVLDPCDPTNDTHWGDQNTALTGTSADWRIVVTNTGDTELTDVEIDDPTVPACSADITSSSAISRK